MKRRITPNITFEFKIYTQQKTKRVGFVYWPKLPYIFVFDISKNTQPIQVWVHLFPSKCNNLLLKISKNLTYTKINGQQEQLWRWNANFWYVLYSKLHMEYTDLLLHFAQYVHTQWLQKLFKGFCLLGWYTAHSTENLVLQKWFV